MKTGKVYLVGAGPGDPKLITLKAIECLAKADVVIYDRLVDDSLLELVPEKAEKFNVGKMPGKHGMEQVEINRLIVEKARKKKLVVRLKGGDPFVFGRGGEEALALADNCISFEMIPGISSAIAVPAYAGIPVTHRGIASSFTVITGHEAKQKGRSRVNWSKLSTSADTLVFLMGMENINKITKMLIKYGMHSSTPVAVVSNGTRPEQSTIVGSLNNIADKVHQKSIAPPAVIVVGKVVNLRKKLSWFDNRPLFGKRILVTRARHQAGHLCRLLAEKGAEPIMIPVIQIKPVVDKHELDKAIENINSYNWILFTSVNGVTTFFNHLNSRNLDARVLGQIKVGVIGTATAEAIKSWGIIPDFVPVEYTSRGMIKGLNKYNLKGLRFLIPRSDIIDDELSQGIHKCGAEAESITIYRTQSVKHKNAERNKLFCLDNVDVITFTSASTVCGLLNMIPGNIKSAKMAKIACIGPKTANAAMKSGLHVDIVAKDHTMGGLVAAIEEYFSKEK